MYKITKDNLDKLAAQLAEHQPVFAPQEDSSGVVAYDWYSGKKKLVWGVKTRRSAKEAYFPQSEVLLNYRIRDGKVEQEEPQFSSAFVLMGIHPCDARSFTMLDKLFGWDYDDERWQERRRNSVIISIACPGPISEGCFCMNFRGNPFGTENVDLLVARDGDAYHVKVASEKGEKFIAEHKQFFTEDGDEGRFGQLQQKAETSFVNSPRIDDPDIWKRMQENFDHPIWRELSLKCIECGVCTWLCCTCHCFDVQDEGEWAGKRERIWDGCSFKEFTKMPSHQPRPAYFQRYRQRIMHKYGYFVERFGMIACVACGRCIDHCPTNIDITQILNKLNQVLPAEGEKAVCNE